jgi:hypothetical protein
VLKNDSDNFLYMDGSTKKIRKKSTFMFGTSSIINNYISDHVKIKYIINDSSLTTQISNEMTTLVDNTSTLWNPDGVGGRNPDGIYGILDIFYNENITGNIYDIPAEKWSKNGNKYIFKDIPVYDAPILIADKSLINL